MRHQTSQAMGVAPRRVIPSDRRIKDVHGLREELVRFAERLAGATRAEDLVQEAFVRVMRRGAGVPRDENGLPRVNYMYAVIKNLMLDALRKAVADELGDDQDTRLVCPRVADEGAGETPRLLDLLHNLPQRQWEATILTAVRGLTETQAATCVGGSRTALAGTRERAIRRLRAQMERDQF